MTTKALEALWHWYPQSHLHCDVTLAGQDSYRIVMSLIDSAGEVIATIDYYGSGNLAELKEVAAERLAQKLEEAFTA